MKHPKFFYNHFGTDRFLRDLGMLCVRQHGVRTATVPQLGLLHTRLLTRLQCYTCTLFSSQPNFTPHPLNLLAMPLPSHPKHCTHKVWDYTTVHLPTHWTEYPSPQPPPPVYTALLINLPVPLCNPKVLQCIQCAICSKQQIEETDLQGICGVENSIFHLVRAQVNWLVQLDVFLNKIGQYWIPCHMNQ